MIEGLILDSVSKEYLDNHIRKVLVQTMIPMVVHMHL